jgi:hypothetical protein
MKQFLSCCTEGLAWARRGRVARCASIAVALAASSLGCSDTAPDTISTGGSGGQVSGGSAGSGVVAGSSGTSTGGTPPAASGAAGMAGSSSGGGSAGAGGSTGGSGGAGGSAGSGGGGGGGGGGGDDGWVSLFNGTSLEGWTPGNGSAPLFAAGMLDGEPVIHVYPTQADKSNQPQGWLITNASYSKYVFHLEYKWGTKRFGGRSNEDRDNGICFHAVKPLPQQGETWPTSVELQLGSQAWPGDWVSGNIFMLIDKTRAQWTYTMKENRQVYSPTGTVRTLGAPTQYALGLTPGPNPNLDGGKNDPPATRWNTVELTVNGSESAEYKVNGMVVNALTDMEYQTSGGSFAPLTEGQILVQAEFGEVYFRNIKIKVLP